MAYIFKKIAYLLLYIPILFVPHSQGVDFADKKRISKLPLAVAILVILLALLLIAGVAYLLLVALG